MTPAQIQFVLKSWSQTQNVTATLINLSENHTFRIDASEGRRWILRVHRAGYNSKAEIESELEWMAALRADARIFTPRPIAAIDGDFVQVLEDGTGPRFAVLFEFETGQEPHPDDDLLVSFEQLGALAAQCHAHVQTFSPSTGFKRMSWTAATILHADGLWGDWRQAPGITPSVQKTLSTLCESLIEDLKAYGESADRFGLIHADMRLANLLIDNAQVKLIDFDDCGFGWFGYDFAAAISFMETLEKVPDLMAAWLRGYRQVRAFSAHDEARLHTMIMLRRMALLAWIGSHIETELAQSLEANFAGDTEMLAKRYLENSGHLFD